ncbi:MAG: hypothetical protein ACRDYV_09130 [Acidimicrobiia bacterium]
MSRLSRAPFLILISALANLTAGAVGIEGTARASSPFDYFANP